MVGIFMKKVLFLLGAFIFFDRPMDAAVNQGEYQYLDAIALKAGSDKGSTFHNYTELYSEYFAPLKEKPIKFLEIGIYKGSSVKMWEEYFKNADLHFMDITYKYVEYHSKRSHYYLCDQGNAAELNQFIQKAGGGFDVILDDGGHSMPQQITSFKTLFPHVKSGGMYIIEDLHTSYWNSYGGNGPDSTVNFLKSLIDEVNFVGARTERANHRNLPSSIRGELNIYRESIESMHFYDSVVIIKKR
jgi:hypothetical protein